MLNNLSKTRPTKHDPGNAKLSAFHLKFEESYHALREILDPENTLLIMLMYAYLAYQYQPVEKVKAEKVDSKNAVIQAKESTEILIIESNSVTSLHPPAFNLDEEISKIVYVLLPEIDLDSTVKKLSKLLEPTHYHAIQKPFIKLQKTYAHKENYAKAILPYFYPYLTSLSAKKQWGDSTAISLLYQAVIGDISNLTLYDGASGLGNTSLLLKAHKHILRESHPMPALLSAFVQSLSGNNFDIQIQDSLTAKQKSYQANICICSPSYGMEIKPLWLIGSDYLQFLDILHAIPSSASDSLWVQHCLYHLNATGKAYLILPIGWLFKGGYDLAVREAIVMRNLLESVTILPTGLRQYNQTNLCLVVLNKAKTSEDFWLISAENSILNRHYSGDIAEESIKKIAHLVTHPQENKTSICVKQTQILENKFDLNPSRYFKDSLEIAELELTTELQVLSNCQQQYETAKVKLDELLSLIAPSK